jgi:hypothetical protein
VICGAPAGGTPAERFDGIWSIQALQDRARMNLDYGKVPGLMPRVAAKDDILNDGKQ